MTTDANGYTYDNYPAARASRHQRVLNETWPYTHPDGTPHARPDIETVDYLSPRIPATARIHFETDGWAEIEGHAARWANGCTYFEASDPRLQINGTWLADTDVRRR